jgi:hypothetical protein
MLFSEEVDERRTPSDSRLSPKVKEIQIVGWRKGFAQIFYVFENTLYEWKNVDKNQNVILFLYMRRK